MQSWLQRVDPAGFDDPELASPFIPWPPPKPILESSGCKPNGHEKPEEMTARPPRRSVKFVSPDSGHIPPATPRPTDSPTPFTPRAAPRAPARVLTPSPSPKPRDRKREIHLHLSLTDSQMEKMTSLYVCSPVGARRVIPANTFSSFSTPQKRIAMDSNVTPSPAQPKPQGSDSPWKTHGNVSKMPHHRKGASDPSAALTATANDNSGQGHTRHRHDLDVPGGGSDDDDASTRRAKSRPVNRESDVTTMGELIQHGARGPSASPKEPPSRPAILTSAEQKAKRRPTPLDLRDARKYLELINQRKKLQAVHHPLKTPGEVQHRLVPEDGSSSLYSEEKVISAAPTVSPLRVRKRPNSGSKMNFLRAYHDWKGRNTPAPTSAILKSPFRSKSATVNGMPPPPDDGDNWSTLSPSRRARSGEAGLNKSATTSAIPAGDDQVESFSPLTPWLVGSGDGHTRMASKTLFGYRGWLQDTAAIPKKAEPQKATGFLDGIKKKARELVSSFCAFFHWTHA